MEELKHLGCNVYMAHGKVVKVDDVSVDVSTDAGRDEVLTFAKNVFEGRLSPRPWGDLTVAVMLPCVDGPHGRKHVVSCSHFGDMPDQVKENLRKEFPDYAGQI